MFVEGPYGSPPPLHNFTNILFLVGGTGIAVPLSHLSSLLSSHSTAKITIIWAVRELAFLESTIATDLRTLGGLDSEKLDLKAYVTRDAENVDKVDREEGIGIHPVQLSDESGKRFTVTRGRPDVKSEVSEAVRELRNVTLAVVACGPGQMADEARKAVVDALGRSSARVEYFEESFKW
jgi:NAD(P)H-flavin reductase